MRSASHWLAALSKARSAAPASRLAIAARKCPPCCPTAVRVATCRCSCHPSRSVPASGCRRSRIMAFSSAATS
eukprot:2521351-Lingulodinium_polyedra.AAC.1